jgi:hypothetical protein
MRAQKLNQTETCNYLGNTLNNKGNMEDHIRKLKGNTEAAIQTIFSIAGNDEFHNIEMATIWRLFNTCIIPIITYGAETWTPTKTVGKNVPQAKKHVTQKLKEYQTNKIYDNTQWCDLEIQVFTLAYYIDLDYLLKYRESCHIIRFPPFWY